MSQICTFDGGCEPNPGGAMGWGWTIGDEAFYGCAPAAPVNTNNVAEYKALIALLEMLKERGVQGARICGDSQVVVYQMTGDYGVKSANLYELADHASRLLDETASSIRWHPREENEVADAMSVKGLAEQGAERIDLSAYATRLGDIGSARQVGKWLTERGYRKDNGYANDKAEAEGWVKSFFITDSGRRFGMSKTCGSGSKRTGSREVGELCCRPSLFDSGAVKKSEFVFSKRAPLSASNTRHKGRTSTKTGVSAEPCGP